MMDKACKILPLVFSTIAIVISILAARFANRSAIAAETQVAITQSRIETRLRVTAKEDMNHRERPNLRVTIINDGADVEIEEVWFDGGVMSGKVRHAWTPHQFLSLANRSIHTDRSIVVAFGANDIKLMDKALRENCGGIIVRTTNDKVFAAKLSENPDLKRYLQQATID